MADGTVTATSLNLRNAPGGDVVGLLVRGTTLSVQEQSGEWLRISADVDGQTLLGWVSAKFVTLGTPTASVPPGTPAVPPPDDAANQVTVQGSKAIGPDGKSFATVSGGGFVTYGKTTLADWLQTNPQPSEITASMVRTVRAASLNEGKLEAINSYDDAFLSFGIFQWTAGTGDSLGELAALLDLIRRTDANAFTEYFGRYGVGVAVHSTASTTGFLTINDAVLQTPAGKEQLRRPEWAYRFWRAGHDDTVRRCQLLHAAARIEQFYQTPAVGHPVADWLTSQYGVALVLDEHINRPGHVPGTLQGAIARLPNAMIDPAHWTTAEEAQLIQFYIEARNATNMTRPVQRGAQISDCVHDGTLSDQRGSFLTAAAATGV